MKILVIGDVTSPAGVEHLSKRLWKFREAHRIDFCVVNGENASFITGISPQLAEKLLRGGADCITGGNHTLSNKAAYTMLEECESVLRPVNAIRTAATTRPPKQITPGPFGPGVICFRM